MSRPPLPEDLSTADDAPVARSGATGEPPPFRRIAIVGFGLIGGSVGAAVKRRWPNALVTAIDRPDVVETARGIGAADDGGVDLALAAAADLVVLAAPVGVNIRTLAELAEHIPGGAVVTDVGSTKRETIAAAAQLPSRLRFIGGHPLAGAAISGVASARADLFTGRPWVLMPVDASHAGDVARLTAWIESLGATVLEMTADEHDRLMSLLSHLPQLTATALMHVVGTLAAESGLAIAGRGLRDTTRLASSSAAVWRDIVATNQDNIAVAVDALIAALQQIRADLDGSGGALVRTFDSAGAWKKVLERTFANE